MRTFPYSPLDRYRHSRDSTKGGPWGTGGGEWGKGKGIGEREWEKGKGIGGWEGEWGQISGSRGK